MVRMLISNRIHFDKKNVQRKFITDSKESLGVSWIKFAEKISVNPRTLSDWTREKFNIPEQVAIHIATLCKTEIPKNYHIVYWNDHLKKISASGGKATVLKYNHIGGDKKYRLEKWRTWWQEIGQYQKAATGFKSLIQIHRPRKDKKLAEFVGIMLGDGGIAKNHITITLSNKEWNYIEYIKSLIYQLFEVESKVYKKKNAEAVEIVVHRKELVAFCQEIGLVQGSKIKQQVDIPEWILVNKVFSIECVKGLIDTDGCFYVNTYYVHGKKYTYLKIAFTNSSIPLIKSVAKILKNAGYLVQVNRQLKDVRIVDSSSVERYIQKIGSHNQKHLDKYKGYLKKDSKKLVA